MTTIVPTNGRVMWFHPKGLLGITQHDKSVPLAAIVCHVWGPHMVNLDVIDSSGTHHARTSVPIVQDGSPFTAGESPYAVWMPYQTQQAAKHEALATPPSWNEPPQPLVS